MSLPLLCNTVYAYNQFYSLCFNPIDARIRNLAYSSYRQAIVFQPSHHQCGYMARSRIKYETFWYLKILDKKDKDFSPVIIGNRQLITFQLLSTLL